jgi:hypothetical protein
MPPGASLSDPVLHSLSNIPDSVRKLTATDHFGLTLVFDQPILWIIRGPYSTHANLSLFEPLTVSYMSRAKGAGFVAINAKPIGMSAPYFTLLDFGAYSESAVEQATLFAGNLQQVLGYAPVEQYWGSDC